MKKLSNQTIKKILGGRDVVKIDVDGDGDWDLKYVYGKHGEIRKIKART